MMSHQDITEVRRQEMCVCVVRVVSCVLSLVSCVLYVMWKKMYCCMCCRVSAVSSILYDERNG